MPGAGIGRSCRRAGRVAGRRAALGACLSLALHAAPALAAPPAVTHDCAPRVHTLPRPCDDTTDIPQATTIYFEVTVPETNPVQNDVDPGSVTATLAWPGGGPVPMLRPGQAWGEGFAGRTIPLFTDNGRRGYGFYVVSQQPLLAATAYTVSVGARTLLGETLDPAGAAWSFTTRPPLAGSTARFDVDLAAPALTWRGRFFAGTVKPNFGTSEVFNQEPVYTLLDAARADAPEFMLQQRDWPLFADFWQANGFFDGNPNLVRERETRRITRMLNGGTYTALTVADMLEAPLYNIAPNRPLSTDYHAGDKVLVCDRYRCENATVLSANDTLRQVNVSRLDTPPSGWTLDWAGSTPADNPATPDNFSLPLGTLRKLSPAGTPRFYWNRLDDEWDRHVRHGRRPHVNFAAPSYDLSRTALGQDPSGGDSPYPPKDWTEWHDVVKAVVFHLLDRYGPRVADWTYTVGNEPDLDIFWKGTDNEFLAFYDHTTNAIFKAFEERGIDSTQVRVGGPEATGLFDGYVTQILYHASPTAVNPGAGFEERNFVCLDPAFEPLRSQRLAAHCAAYADRGAPIDLISVHAYKRAAEVAATLNSARHWALSLDGPFFAGLSVNSHETTPDWMPGRDPGSREMYRWGGYFSSWGADVFRRLLDEAVADPRRRAGEVTLTVWPFNTNFAGYASIAGQLRIDADGDGTEDRVDAVPVPFFHMAHLAARMSHDVAPLAAAEDAGARLSGWRSVEPDADLVLLYAHDADDAPGDERGGWDVTLVLTNLRFPLVEVTEYRIDRDHPARAELEALPVRGDNGLYRPEEVAALEAAAQLAPYRAPERIAVTGGRLELATRLLAQGVVFVEIRRPDPDRDGVYDPDDNCPDVVNPDQLDADGDLHGDACDCAPGDPLAFAAPRELTGLRFGTDRKTVAWDPAAPSCGGGTVHDLFREAAEGVPAGGAAGGTCLAPGTPASSFADADRPAAGAGFRYLVRARNTCAAGPWGDAADGTPRSVHACP
jgi:hypothetical protein